MGICSAARISLGTLGLATVVLFSLGVNAQTAKVVKVSGKKAIVQFPDDARPRVGQTIDLSGGGGGDMGGGGGGGSRATIIGGSASLSNLSESTSTGSTTRLAANGNYGWNTGIMEYGPLATFEYVSETGQSMRVLGAGGFFDYNLVPNTPGNDLVYGLGAQASFASTSRTSGSAEVTGTQMSFQGGGQFKWFPLGNTVAVRGDAVYKYTSGSEGGISGNVSGIVVLGGFYIYF